MVQHFTNIIKQIIVITNNMENLDYDTIGIIEINCFDCSKDIQGLTIHGRVKEIEDLPKNRAVPTSYTRISFMKDGKEVDYRRTLGSVDYFREKYLSNK